MPESSFYQKNGLAIMMLARDLLCMKEGDRMTPISEYTEQLDVSRWTIQTAMKFLLEKGCMSVEKRGTLGTFVHQIDTKKLWNYSGLNPLIGLTSLPTCNILEGLMTGLNESFQQTDAPVLLTYMLPAQKRLESVVAKRCQFTVTSRLGLELIKQEFPQLKEVMVLNGVLYSQPFQVYCKKKGFKEVEEGMKIGIYNESIEQKYLTEQLCKGKNVIYKYGTYQDLLEMYDEGVIDVLVYRGDANIQDIINDDEGSDYPIKELYHDSNLPVVVANDEEYGIDNILKSIFLPGLISTTQKEVLEKKRRPRFY